MRHRTELETEEMLGRHPVEFLPTDAVLGLVDQVSDIQELKEIVKALVKRLL